MKVISKKCRFKRNFYWKNGTIDNNVLGIYLIFNIIYRCSSRIKKKNMIFFYLLIVVFKILFLLYRLSSFFFILNIMIFFYLLGRHLYCFVFCFTFLTDELKKKSFIRLHVSLFWLELGLHLRIYVSKAVDLNIDKNVFRTCNVVLHLLDIWHWEEFSSDSYILMIWQHWHCHAILKIKQILQKIQEWKLCF